MIPNVMIPLSNLGYNLCNPLNFAQFGAPAENHQQAIYSFISSTFHSDKLS